MMAAAACRPSRSCRPMPFPPSSPTSLPAKIVAVAAVARSPWPIEQKYRHDGYNKFLDPDGYPAVEPPWGTLNAIDLNKGEIAWKIPFGEYPELAAKGLRHTGSENYGGPVVTAGGLLFIAATNHDRKFHAFDKATGRAALGNHAARGRQRHARDLRGRWAPVRGRRGRGREVGRAFRRKLRGLRPAPELTQPARGKPTEDPPGTMDSMTSGHLPPLFRGRRALMLYSWRDLVARDQGREDRLLTHCSLEFTRKGVFSCST